MGKCKNPKCGKTLIGKEKVFCTSCKEKFVEGTKDVGKKALAVGGTVLLLKEPIKKALKKVPIKKIGQQAWNMAKRIK